MGDDSRRIDRWLLVGTVLVFILASAVAGLERGLVFAVLFGTFSAVLQAKWEDRREFRVWGLLSIFLIVHIAAILLIKFPQTRFAAIVVPIAIIDGLAIYWLINWLGRRDGRTSA